MELSPDVTARLPAQQAASAPPAAATAAAPTSVAAPAKPASGGFTFHDLLSALNPLQYAPVVGTIYRSVIGDTIPEPLRVAGSLITSALMGGPVGLVITAGTTVAEGSLGLDPDKLLHAALQEVGLAGPDAPKPGQAQAAYGAASGQTHDKPAPAARTQGDAVDRAAGYAAYLLCGTTPPGGMG